MAAKGKCKYAYIGLGPVRVKDARGKSKLGKAIANVET